ncbi:Hok/Gef family protein [Escherichia coli]|uniref:Hok/Gef family protein n=1 Tax=Escherichia coli TaxID=562 RepID=UPI001BC906EE|nr:Hok/Gef family protein [Escherichia coli]
MKQQKAMLVALIVICLTVIVTALVTRKDLCEVRIRTGQKPASAGFLLRAEYAG